MGDGVVANALQHGWFLTNGWTRSVFRNFGAMPPIAKSAISGSQIVAFVGQPGFKLRFHVMFVVKLIFKDWSCRLSGAFLAMQQRVAQKRHRFTLTGDPHGACTSCRVSA
jgi:hypothetical protein